MQITLLISGHLWRWRLSKNKIKKGIQVLKGSCDSEFELDFLRIPWSLYISYEL